VSTGCGDARPTPEKQKTGCGDASPATEKKKVGCGSTDPVATANDLVLKRLLEEDVKNRFGWLLDKFGIVVPQEKLDHVEDRHLEGGKEVYLKLGKPKTLFNDEKDIIDIFAKTLQSGQPTAEGTSTKYEYDFGRPIGKTVDGKPLTKVRVVIGNIPNIGKRGLITMYPIE
jgi:hypothetical protein